MKSEIPTGAEPVAPGKRPYVRPEVTRVLLRAEEAVLGGCKQASSGGVGDAADCTVCFNAAS